MSYRKYYLLNYIFIIGLVLLLLNDHIFKWEFSNWVTGKLSDFVGLLIFPFFLTFLFPKAIKWNVIFTGLFFVLWKSPYSQGFIDVYNSITFIKITRVVDYSDLIALSVLPLSYYYMKRVKDYEKLRIEKISIHPIFILLPVIIVFMATSPPARYYYNKSNGNLRFFKSGLKVNMSKEDVLIKMEQYKIEAYLDTIFENPDYVVASRLKLNYYKVDQIVFDNDTIRDLQFSMMPKKGAKTKIFLNGMNISKEIKEDELKKELRKYYKKLLRKYIKETLKN